MYAPPEESEYSPSGQHSSATKSNADQAVTTRCYTGHYGETKSVSAGLINAWPPLVVNSCYIRSSFGSSSRRIALSHLLGLPVQCIDQKLGSRTRRGWILAGDQLAVGDRVNAPVLHLGKGGTEAHRFVLDKEGYHFRQSYLFLAIGEAGHGLALYEQLAVRDLDMAQRAGRVADQREGLGGIRCYLLPSLSSP